jgi:hypothetical protein
MGVSSIPWWAATGEVAAALREARVRTGKLRAPGISI